MVFPFSHLNDAAKLAQRRIERLGGIGQQRAFHFELVVVVRDERDFLQGIKRHPVQLDQHLGVAVGGVEALQPQVALWQWLREDANLGGDTKGVAGLERGRKTGDIQKLDGTKVCIDRVVRAQRQGRRCRCRIVTTKVDTLGWARK